MTHLESDSRYPVNYDIVRSKHKERSYKDCRVTKQDFQSSEKLIHHPSNRMGCIVR